MVVRYGTAAIRVERKHADAFAMTAAVNIALGRPLYGVATTAARTMVLKPNSTYSHAIGLRKQPLVGQGRATQVIGFNYELPDLVAQLGRWMDDVDAEVLIVIKPSTQFTGIDFKSPMAAEILQDQIASLRPGRGITTILAPTCLHLYDPIFWQMMDAHMDLKLAGTGQIGHSRPHSGSMGYSAAPLPEKAKRLH